MSLYKGKGDKCECSNWSGISLLSVFVRLYGRVLIQRVRAETECAIVMSNVDLGRVEGKVSSEWVRRILGVYGFVGGCERNVVHTMTLLNCAWGVLKSVVSDRGLGIKE